MTYADYIEAAETCCNYTEAERIITIAADDEKISARQYYNIRHLAIRAAYENS